MASAVVNKDEDKKSAATTITIKSLRTGKSYKIKTGGRLLDSEDLENYHAMVEEWENEQFGPVEDEDHDDGSLESMDRATREYEESRF